MPYLAYNVWYSVALIDSSLLTVTLYSSVRTTFVYYYTKYISRRYKRVLLHIKRTFSGYRLPSDSIWFSVARMYCGLHTGLYVINKE